MVPSTLLARRFKILDGVRTYILYIRRGHSDVDRYLEVEVEVHIVWIISVQRWATTAVSPYKLDIFRTWREIPVETKLAVQLQNHREHNKKYNDSYDFRRWYCFYRKSIVHSSI